jgi:hypothetical protein
MSESIYARGGSSPPGDRPASDGCGEGDATAIAKPEDVHRAKAAPTARTDGARIRRTRGQEHPPLSCAAAVPTRSILRKYDDYSFLQLCAFSLFWWGTIVALFLLAMLG